MRMKKLFQDDRTEIVRRSRAGETQQALAAEYDVAQSTINRALNKERRREVMTDPFPAISDEILQKRYWAKCKRLTVVWENRKNHLNIDRKQIQQKLSYYKSEAKKAPTLKLKESYQKHAESCRLELAALDDLSDFDSEIADLCKDLYILSQVLFKIRKVGLGCEVLA